VFLVILQFVPGRVGGQPVDMLVDTGSAVMLVHYQKQIFLGGVTVFHPVLVAADITQDCLLGIDFLGKHNCKIDFDTKTIQFGREVVDLEGKSELSKVLRISLAETVVVPSHHEMVLPAKFKGAECGDGLLGLVEPSPGFAERHDLLLTQVVAQPKENMVPVHVVNLSPTPVTLYQNTSVGTFSQVEDSAVEPVSCNRLATKKTRTQTRPLASKQFDLDTMNLTSTQKYKLANLLDNSQISSPLVQTTSDEPALLSTR